MFSTEGRKTGDGEGQTSDKTQYDDCMSSQSSSFRDERYSTAHSLPDADPDYDKWNPPTTSTPYSSRVRFRPQPDITGNTHRDGHSEFCCSGNTFRSTQRSTLKPEKFDGTGDWSDFLKHFEMVATWNEWTEAEKIAQLSMSFTGVARETWSDTCTNTSALRDYNALVATMSQRFRPEGQEEAFKAEFRGRVKQASESFRDYGHSLRRLVIRAFPGIPYEAKDEVACDQFLLGLGDPEMRKHVSLQHPTSLDHAVIIATEYQTISHSVRASWPQKPVTVAAVSGNGGGGTTNRSECVDDIVKALDEIRGKQTRVPRRGRCYFCDEPGHIMRTCPTFLAFKQSCQGPLN